MGHFKGEIWAWDVVNEAFEDDGTGNLRDSLWLRELGPGYIADAFRWAHKADPKAILFYNDYNTEGINTKSDAVYKLVKELRERGRADPGLRGPGPPEHRLRPAGRTCRPTSTASASSA